MTPQMPTCSQQDPEPRPDSVRRKSFRNKRGAKGADGAAAMQHKRKKEEPELVSTAILTSFRKSPFTVEFTNMYSD